MAVVVGVWQMAAGRVIISNQISPPQIYQRRSKREATKVKCPQMDRNDVRALHSLGHKMNH